jgi:hypothetical protein
MGTDSAIGVKTHTVAQTLDATRRRDLGCEGIPMILALHGAAPAGPHDPRRAHGVALARRLGAIHAQVARLAEHPATRSKRETAVAADSAAVEGAASHGAPADAREEARLEAEAARAVSPAERLLAEAITVLAHAELAEPQIELELGAAEDPSSVDGRAPDGPLARMQRALIEGRFVTVVNYHNTPARSAAEIRSELARWAGTYAPVGVEQLARLCATGRWEAARPPLIPVFYEGYRNNVEVGAPACERAGLIGWFFLITGFLDAQPAAQEDYAREHEIALAAEELGADAPVAMTWEQAAELARVHVVTSHTASHCAAHRVTSPEAAEAEIAAPARTVRGALRTPAVAHAWLFGSDLAHDSRHIGDLHRAEYRWLFSNTGIDDIGAWARGEVRWQR